MNETEPEKSITNNKILLNSIINSVDVLANYAVQYLSICYLENMDLVLNTRKKKWLT